jgi:cytidylate kinase
LGEAERRLFDRKSKIENRKSLAVSSIISGMIITIDGPAGVGKSTAARLLARRLGFAFLDTGATYRAATLRCLRRGVDLHDPLAVRDCVAGAAIELRGGADGLTVLLDGEDVSDAIRSEAVSEASHHVAGDPACREVLVELQRRVAGELGDVVTEGRDQGTVVFPGAEVKFYLEADPAERARRRTEQLQRRGESARFERVRSAIEARDRRDQSRAAGPLKAPPGAIRIDNTALDAEGTVSAMLAAVEAVR